jgi:hypothetical protein
MEQWTMASECSGRRSWSWSRRRHLAVEASAAEGIIRPAAAATGKPGSSSVVIRCNFVTPDARTVAATSCRRMQASLRRRLDARDPTGPTAPWAARPPLRTAPRRLFDGRACHRHSHHGPVTPPQARSACGYRSRGRRPRSARGEPEPIAASERPPIWHGHLEADSSCCPEDDDAQLDGNEHDHHRGQQSRDGRKAYDSITGARATNATVIRAPGTR